MTFADLLTAIKADTDEFNCYGSPYFVYADDPLSETTEHPDRYKVDSVYPDTMTDGYDLYSDYPIVVINLSRIKED